LGSAGKSGTRTHARRGAQVRVLRIIGGTWRGRKLRFAAGADIRPTPDRVRETLFNWLGPRVAGARCLDLFAGSGALGLEALSRGAAQVTFVEQDARAARELAGRLLEWQAQGGHVARADALRFLAGPAGAYGVVFLDPPFASDLLARAAAALAVHGWLAPGALIYVEAGARDALPPLPPEWRLLKAKQAGEVGYYLFAHAGADA
jgi:16S rRNA (guanine966-N2)-methyltransferase